MSPLTQGLLIGFFGSALYLAVDKYEPDRTLAFMLKLLVVIWVPLPCSTALLAAGFSNSRICLHENGPAAKSGLVDLERARCTPLTRMASFDGKCPPGFRDPSGHAKVKTPER